MISPIGHLGAKASALLDGQLPEDEAERAWAHIHHCHACRDEIEREGWVKRRLAGLAFDPGTAAPASLKGSLKGSLLAAAPTPGEVYLALHDHRSRRTTVGLAALGGGAVGAAMMGVLALGAAPASAPTTDRPLPTASVTTPSTPTPVTVGRRDR